MLPVTRIPTRKLRINLIKNLGALTRQNLANLGRILVTERVQSAAPQAAHRRLRHSALALSLALNAACPVCVPDLSNRPTGKLEMVSRQFSRPPGRRGDCRRGVGSRISVCCTASEHPPLITGYLGLVMAPPWGLDHSRRPSIVAALRVCWGHARPCPPSAYPPTSSSLLA